MRELTAAAVLVVTLFSVSWAYAGGGGVTSDPITEWSAWPDGSGMVSVVVDCQRDPTTVWRAEVTCSSGWSARLESETGAFIKRQSQLACGAHGKLPTFEIWFWPDEELDSADSEWLVIHISLLESNGTDKETSSSVVFRRIDGQLVLSSHEEYLDSQVEILDGGAALPEAMIQVAPAELASLAPWDSPVFSAEKRAEWKAMRGETVEPTETGNYALSTGPLEAAPAEDVSAADASGGCTAGANPSNGGLLALLGLIAVCAGLWFGKRLYRLAVFGLFVSGTVLALPTPAAAVEGCVYGYYAFWDTRGYLDNGDASDEPGSRVLTCVSADTTCLPGDAGCCFKGIPRTKVLLKRACQGQPATTVAENVTDDDGVYMLCEQDWRNDCYYSVQVWFERLTGNVWPLKAKAQVWSTGYTYYASSSWFYMPSQYYYLPRISVNLAQDETSSGGEVATAWRTIYEAARAMTDEGETRYRKEFGSANTYDTVFMRYPRPTTGSAASCAASEIHLTAGISARGAGPAEELGHLAHGRVVGCDGGVHVFPQYIHSAHSYQTSESNALSESIGLLVKLLTWWDPDVAETYDIFNDFADCVRDVAPNTVYNNSNYASADRNNYLALWEFVDTTTTNNWGGYGDCVDVTLKDMFDALLVFQAYRSDTCVTDNDCPARSNEVCLIPYPAEGTTKYCHGRNRTKDERYHYDGATRCTGANVSEGCPSGQVCYENTEYCQAGDPHGGNIRDWMYHLGLNEGIPDLNIINTLYSSQCMRGADDTTPFELGYRNN